MKRCPSTSSSTRLGHADMRTASLHAAQRPEHGEELVAVLERRHHLPDEQVGADECVRI
jgi:hypothetical protein